MDAPTLLRLQLQNAHQTLEGTMGEISNDEAHREPGGRAFKVAANYGHIIFAEDGLVNGMFKQTAPLFASTWSGRTGFSEPMPNPAEAGWAEGHDSWARRLLVDLPAARAYAQAVHASADAYLASLKPDDLDRDIDMSFVHMPPMPLGLALSMLVIGHAYCLAGEISASKGALGLQGYPF